MMIRERTDVHRPSAIRPEDYEYIASYDTHPPMPPWVPADLSPQAKKEIYAQFRAMLEERNKAFSVVIESSTSVYHSPNRCDHCGAHLRYVSFYQHIPSGQAIAVGEDCAFNTLEVPDRARLDQKRLREAAAAARMREAADKAACERREQAEAAYPEAIQILTESVYAHPEASSLMQENPIPWFRVDDLPFIEQIGVKYLRKGYLSEKQAAAVVRAHNRNIERAKREAEKAEKVARGEIKPCPEGKGISIEGEVVSTKLQENDFGSRYVMTVKTDDGWAVWGTEPSIIEGAGDEEEVKGKRIRFVANVTRSDRDETFGFFKRPRKAEVVAEGEEKAHSEDDYPYAQSDFLYDCWRERGCF